MSTQEGKKNTNYSRVLRRYDRSPDIPMRFASYDVNLNSRSEVLEGKRALTLFFPPGKENAAARATKLGWIDETERWNAAHGNLTENTKDPEWKNLNWNQFRKYAGSRGIDLSGKRADIENRLVEYELKENA